MVEVGADGNQAPEHVRTPEGDMKADDPAIARAHEMGRSPDHTLDEPDRVVSQRLVVKGTWHVGRVAPPPLLNDEDAVVLGKRANLRGPAVDASEGTVDEDQRVPAPVSLVIQVRSGTRA